MLKTGEEKNWFKRCIDQSETNKKSKKTNIAVDDQVKLQPSPSVAVLHSSSCPVRSLPFQNISNHLTVDNCHASKKEKPVQPSASTKEAQVAKAATVKSSNVIWWNPEQTQSMTFPIGCRVSTNLQFDENGVLRSCDDGQVVGVCRNTAIVADVKYEVMPANENREDYSVLVDESEIVYTVGSEVLHSPIDGDETMS